MCPIFMKFGTQNKSNMLIVNILTGIEALYPKLQILRNLVAKLKCAPIVMKLEQMEHANYEYSTWN